MVVLNLLPLLESHSKAFAPLVRRYSTMVSAPCFSLKGEKWGPPFPTAWHPGHTQINLICFLDVNHHPKSIKSDDEIG